MIKLRLPLEHIRINQGFGLNYADFYKKLGLNGHNGIDFTAKDGCPCYAAHDGMVAFAGKDGDGGISVTLWDKTNRFKTLYYHLKEVKVKLNQYVKAGDLVGLCDNTGKYTTGDHLHFGLKEVDEWGNTLYKKNGYSGSIDAAPYFFYNFKGDEIKNSDWNKSRCYHRYYRGRPNGGLINEAKILSILVSKKIAPTAEKINALVYGGWDLNSVKNPAMYELWSQLKKDEFERGFRPFEDNRGK